MKIQKKYLVHFLIIALFGAFASVMMFWITVYGPFVGPDSVAYIETARSLLAGNGFYAGDQPMTHYSPVYPLLLAMAGLFQHGDVLQAGRWLCVILFGANIILLGIAVLICTEFSLPAAGCAMFVFIASSPIISIHSMAWSEAPFTTFTLAAFVLISLYIARPRSSLILAASLSAGCAMATRYAGVTLLPPVVLVLIFLGDRPMKHKIRDTFIFTTIALLPLASWLIRNMVTTETLTDRTLAIHVFSSQHIKNLISTMYDFALPMSMSDGSKAFYLGFAAIFFLVSLAFLHKKNYISSNANTIRIILPALCILFFFTYISFLVISVSFFDAHTPLNARILLPAFLVISIAGISLAWSFSSVLDSRIIWYSFIGFVFLSVTLNSFQAMTAAIIIHRDGYGFTSRQWKNSETIVSAMSLAGDMKIYSNGSDIIQFLTGRRVTMIPSFTNPETLKPNEDYEKQMQVMCREVDECKAIVVYLNGITWRQYLPAPQALEAKCVMPVLGRLNDGSIYGRSKRKAEKGAAQGGDSAVRHYRQ